MSLYRDSGVVLRTYKLGEADRIVVICTRAHGKVRAVAKGVRRTRSRFGARLEPLSHVSLQLHAGRELDLVTQAEGIDHFPTVRGDLDRLAMAHTMLEAIDQLTFEREADGILYKMLVGALRALEGAERAPALVVPGLFLKALSHEGLRPVVEACVMCGSEDALVSYDLEVGGLLCDDHRRGVAISPEAVALLQDVLGGRLASALGAPASVATAEVERMATEALEHHVERRLRSVHVLDRV